MLALFPLRPDEDPLYTNATACGAVQGVHEALDRLTAIPEGLLPPGIKSCAPVSPFMSARSRSAMSARRAGSISRHRPGGQRGSRVQDLTRQLGTPADRQPAFANLPCSSISNRSAFRSCAASASPSEVFAVRAFSSQRIEPRITRDAAKRSKPRLSQSRQIGSSLASGGAPSERRGTTGNGRAS